MLPSGEVALISAVVSEFTARCGLDHPVEYALALLPICATVARVRTCSHSQSDVLVGRAIGTGMDLRAVHIRLL